MISSTTTNNRPGSVTLRILQTATGCAVNIGWTNCTLSHFLARLLHSDFWDPFFKYKKIVKSYSSVAMEMLEVEMEMPCLVCCFVNLQRHKEKNGLLEGYII